MDEEDHVGPVVTLVIAIAIAVSVFTVVVALALAGVFGAAGASTPLPAASDVTARIDFAADSSVLPGTAGSVLFMVVVAAVVDPARHIEVSGYGDARDPLAAARVSAVHEALRAAGIPEDRIELLRPREPSGADAAQTRRVELTLR